MSHWGNPEKVRNHAEASWTRRDGWSFWVCIREVGGLLRKLGTQFRAFGAKRTWIRILPLPFTVQLQQVKFLCLFLISEWELLYFSQRFCKMKWSPGISHTLRPTVVFSLFVNWFVLKYNNGCSCHKRSYVPEDLKYKITNYTLHFRHIFDVIFFTMPSYVFFLILLFLVVDQLIKSNEHLIETVELPLSACLMIFISVSIVKFMRLMRITNSGTCFFPFFMPSFLNDEYKMQFEFLK